MGEPPLIRLRTDETAVVGYGSLLSASSIGKTLGREYEGPFVLCHVEDWRRSWDVSMPNQAFYYEEDGERVYPEKILYLNVRPEPGSLMNCAVFVVDQAELEAMHQREWIYQDVPVTQDLRGLRVEGGDAIMYVARPEHIVQDADAPASAAVRGSYLRMLDQALETVTPEFRREFERTTDPVPQELVVDDVLDPARPNPWAAAGSEYRPELQL
jgi:hypothetical protein